MSVLVEKMRRQIYKKAAAERKGADQLLDLTPIDEEEYVLFCKAGSLLSTKIAYRLKTRAPEEMIRVMLGEATKAYCPVCWERKKKGKCACP